MAQELGHSEEQIRYTWIVLKCGVLKNGQNQLGLKYVK